VFLVSYYALPHEFDGIFIADPTRISKNWHLAVAVISGLWGGLIIGVCTEYYTSNRYQPTKVDPYGVYLHVGRFLLCLKKHLQHAESTAI
jgi:hypothetical protein